VDALVELEELSTLGTAYEIVNGGGDVVQELRFQHGTIQPVNGCTNEQVIALLIHRLRALNERQSCKENVMAITKLEEALLWLDLRERRLHGMTGEVTP
jgi:hypothetical protein